MNGVGYRLVRKAWRLDGSRRLGVLPRAYADASPSAWKSHTFYESNLKDSLIETC